MQHIAFIHKSGGDGSFDLLIDHTSQRFALQMRRKLGDLSRYVDVLYGRSATTAAVVGIAIGALFGPPAVIEASVGGAR